MIKHFPFQTLSFYKMAVILDICVKIMCKLQTDVIVIIRMVDLSKRGSLSINICVLVQKLNLKLVPAAILDLALMKKNAGIFGRDLGTIFFA